MYHFICLVFQHNIFYECLYMKLWTSYEILTLLLYILGLSIDEFSRNKLDLTAKELSEEKDLAYSCLS